MSQEAHKQESSFRWLVNTFISLLAAGGGIVALLMYFEQHQNSPGPRGNEPFPPQKQEQDHHARPNHPFPSLQVRANVQPTVISPGAPVEISVLVLGEQGNPIPEAEVRIEVGGGVFPSSGNTMVIGVTDPQGLFRTQWRCSPCARGYVFGVHAQKEGFNEAEGRCEVAIQ